MKKFVFLLPLFLGGLVHLRAQSSTTPKLAAYSVNDSIASANPVSNEKQVLAPYAIDADKQPASSSSQPELLPYKKEDPIPAPK